MNVLLIVVIITLILLGGFLVYMFLRGRHKRDESNIPMSTFTPASITTGGTIFPMIAYASTIHGGNDYTRAMSPLEFDEYLNTSKPIPDIEAFVTGGASLIAQAIRNTREKIAAEKDVKFDIVSLLIPAKLLANVTQKVIMKYTGATRNLYGLKLFGYLQQTTEIECLVDSEDDEKTKGNQAYIMDKIILVRIHSKLMRIISMNTMITDIFIKSWMAATLEYYKTVFNPLVMLEMAELTFESLTDMSAADCTDIYRFLTKLIIMLGINFYRHKRTACIEWFKSITDKEIFALERAMSIKDPKLPGGRVISGLWTMLDLSIVFREFIPFLLETVSDDDIKFVVDIILMKPHSIKDIVRETNGGAELFVRGATYAIAIAQITQFTVAMVKPKRLQELENETTYEHFVNSVNVLVDSGININSPPESKDTFATIMADNIKDVGTVIKTKTELIKEAFQKLGNNTKALGEDAWNASKQFGINVANGAKQFGINAWNNTRDGVKREFEMMKNPAAYGWYTVARLNYWRQLMIYKAAQGMIEAKRVLNEQYTKIVFGIAQKYADLERALRYYKDYAAYKAYCAKHSVLSSLQEEELKRMADRALSWSKNVGKQMVEDGREIATETWEFGKTFGEKVYQDTKSKVWELFGDIKAQIDDGVLILRDAKGDIIKIYKRARKHIDKLGDDNIVKNAADVAVMVAETVQEAYATDMPEEELMEVVNSSLKTGAPIPGFEEAPKEEVDAANKNEIAALQALPPQADQPPSTPTDNDVVQPPSTPTDNDVVQPPPSTPTDNDVKLQPEVYIPVIQNIYNNPTSTPTDIAQASDTDKLPSTPTDNDVKLQPEVYIPVIQNIYNNPPSHVDDDIKTSPSRVDDDIKTRLSRFDNRNQQSMSRIAGGYHVNDDVSTFLNAFAALMSDM